MELWNKARSFAEETAKRTQHFAEEAGKRSQDVSFGASKFSDIIAETTKLSKEIAAQASKRAEQVRVEAVKRADQIKNLALPVSEAESEAEAQPSLGTQSQENDLERFGITHELQEFIKGITLVTFRDFPLQDDTQFSDVPAVSNVRQDLTEWQEKHAKLVLSTVKEISRLRYELCPRVMTERKFWRIYFILMNSHLAPYENWYMEDAELPSSEQVKDHKVMEAPKVELTSNQDLQEVKRETKTSTSTTEQDLDAFLLGDMGESDDDPGFRTGELMGISSDDDGDGGFDDDLDKDSSDDEKGKS